MQGRWIAISAARARAHRLYGVRGWLITLLWLDTLPVLAVVLVMIAIFRLNYMGESRASLIALSGLTLPLGLVAVAFLRVRWFPVLWFVYGLVQLSVAVYIGLGVMPWAGQVSDLALEEPPEVLLSAFEMVTSVVTMAYVVRSRRVRVTYRHEVRTNDPAAVPGVFDRPDPNESPSEATDHARERAALRRVAQELSSGVMDTQTWMQVMRYHADATDNERTAAYVRARMVVLCPPAHVHPPLWRTLMTGFGALLISVVATMLLVGAVVMLAARLPGSTGERLGVLIAAVLTLCWLAGLFAGARFLRRVA